jgi:hypothetical protein
MIHFGSDRIIFGPVKRPGPPVLGAQLKSKAQSNT